MDCSDLVFSHADLGPTNIIVEVNPRTGAVGVTDFEIAGCVVSPKNNSYPVR